MISRLLVSSLEKSPKSVLLLGPRQVGKSTLMKQLKPDLIYNLADENVFLTFKSQPGYLSQILSDKKKVTIFIDEIQRHPELLNTIQALIDSRGSVDQLKFLITGSSARKLKRGHANLLPGRLFTYQMGPLCAAELSYELKIQRALRFGCLPEPYLVTDEQVAAKLLSSYAGTYLKEEIQAEALTRNLEGFSRFLITSAHSAGQILDFSKIAKQAKIERKVCTRFFEILEDTLIAHRLEVYEGTKGDISKRPKYYFFDGGVLNGLLGNFTVSEDRKGLLFEHLVVNQILASAKARDLEVKLSYFRTRGGYEVDLICEIKDQIYAVEIKSGVVDASVAQHLEKFKSYKKKVAGFFVVNPDSTRRRVGDVVICDINDFLREIGL